MKNSNSNYTFEQDHHHSVSVFNYHCHINIVEKKPFYLSSYLLTIRSFLSFHFNWGILGYGNYSGNCASNSGLSWTFCSSPFEITMTFIHICTDLKEMTNIDLVITLRFIIIISDSLRFLNIQHYFDS